MSIDTVLARLATILEDDITGIQPGSTYAGRPDDVPPGQLPAFVILTGPGDPDFTDEGMDDIMVMTRTYRMFLLVSSWMDGGELDAEIACRPYFAAVYNRLTGCPGLEHPKGKNSLAGVQNCQITADSGVLNIILAGIAYAGIEFTIQVTEYERINYAA